jgi:hypothetical protein
MKLPLTANVSLVLSLGMLALGGVAGCGGSGRPALVPATGTVTLNGDPLEGAIIAFQPIAEGQTEFLRPSRATSDAQGKFTLGTYDPEDGIPVGRYKVAIQKRELMDEEIGDSSSEYADTIPMRYKWITPKTLADPATSGLEAEVTKSGLNPAVFALESSGPPEIEFTGPHSAGNDP